MKKKNTNIEIKLANILQGLHILFTNQRPISNKIIPDFFIEPNICIYADGDYWHNLENVKTNDQKINIYLNKSGYKVIRFTESEINNNPELIKNKLLKYGSR